MNKHRSPSLLQESRLLGLDWRDPGPEPPRNTPWLPMLALLRERPGTWAALKAYASYATAKTRAQKLNTDHPEFEFCARPIDREKLSGRGEVFGRLTEKS